MESIQDYLEDLNGQDMPARLVVDTTPDSLYLRARIVDAENPSEVLLDRLGERYMEVTGFNLCQLLEELDAMASRRPDTEE